MHKEACCNFNLPSPFWAGGGADLFMPQGGPRSADQAPIWPKLKTEVVCWPAGTRHVRQPSRLPWQMLQLALPTTVPAAGDRRASGIRARMRAAIAGTCSTSHHSRHRISGRLSPRPSSVTA